MYTKRVVLKLKDLGFDHEFVASLKKSNAVISGSFILQAIDNVIWNDSDIDIYAPSLQNDQLFSPVEDWLWKNCDKNDKKYEQNNYPELTTELQINAIRIYYINDIKVQIIRSSTFINYESIKNMIINTFDFSFLMNIFDGDNVYIHDLNAINTKTAINNKIDRMTANLTVNIYESKIAKINILTSERFYDEEKSHSITIHYRCLKYIDRGYTITNYTKPNIIYMPVLKGDFTIDDKKINTYGLCSNTCYLNYDAIQYLITHPITKYYILYDEPSDISNIKLSFNKRDDFLFVRVLINKK